MNTKLKSIFKTITLSLGALLLVTTATYAIGTLTPSGTVGDDTQYTLNDIYTKLTTGADATVGSGLFTTPTGTPVASFHSLSEIYTALPDWQTLSDATTAIQAGYYEATDLATVDTDLIAANIADGVTLFGIVGTLTSADPGLPKTGQTTSYTPNDDGDLETGITMSYTDNNDGTIADNVTGLIWQKSGAYNATSWQDAMNYCINNIAVLPGTGWRLPNIKELQSIVDYGQYLSTINPLFTNTQSDKYWSNTIYDFNQDYAWYVRFNDGYINAQIKTNSLGYVRCVR